MQNHRFFLYIVFLFLISCSKDWGSAEQDIVDLWIRGDALHFSKGFSIALIEGTVPEKTITGSTTTVSWKEGEVELALQFSGRSPEVKLIGDFNATVKDLASISGRMMSDKSVVANFGGTDFKLSPNLLRSPSGTGSLYVKNVMQLHLPFLYSIQKSEKATRWRYVDDVDLGCKISSRESTGYLRIGLPRIDVLTREPDLSAQVVAVISAPEGTAKPTLTQKMNTIMNGHSQTSDPRFGNGGLAIVEGSATLLGKESVKVQNVSLISAYNRGDCSQRIAHLKGKPDLLYFPGVGYIVRSEKSTSRIFRRASLRKMKTSQLTTIAHLVLDETLLIQEGQDWTLSERSALDFADLELFAEEGKTEVLGAKEYIKRLESVKKVSWSWSPEGRLGFDCNNCDALSVLVRIENLQEMSIPPQPNPYNLKGTDLLEWDFGNENHVFKFESYRPKGIHWRFQVGK